MLFELFAAREKIIVKQDYYITCLDVIWNINHHVVHFSRWVSKRQTKKTFVVSSVCGMHDCGPAMLRYIVLLISDLDKIFTGSLSITLIHYSAKRNTSVISIFEVKLTFEMSTVHGQQHSLSTHKRVFLRKCQSFWDRKFLDLRGTWTPNLRIRA